MVDPHRDTLEFGVLELLSLADKGRYSGFHEIASSREAGG